MSNSFFNKSREIANDFLQSIVFLDDRAHSTLESSAQDRIHDLDAIKITKLFSKSKKICAVYDPETLEDISNFEEISKKSDVIILDWYIDIDESKNNLEDLNSDAEEDDIRGKYTKKIISNLISQNNTESIKLIIVYTGETDLLDILNQIVSLSEKSNKNEENFEVYIGNFKILVRAKDNNSEGEDTRFKHLPQSQKMIVSYEKLPNFILDEFTQMTTGLLSNFALLSLTSLRQNSSKLLALFSKEIDSAFLSHKVLLPNQDDAESLLIELFGDSIIALLFYNKIGDSLDKELINDWVEENIIEEKFEIADKSFQRTKEMIFKLIRSGDTNITNRIVNSFEGNGNLSNKQKESYIINSTSLFLSQKDQHNSTKINLEFAKLTHHKSLFLPNNIEPKLTLGTIIKSTKNGNYYICIQQKCDSVRLKFEEERKFLFLPFVTTLESKFDIITHDEVKLVQDKKSFSIRTIKFKCDNEDGVIKGAINGANKYIFKQKYSSEEDEQFEWVLDLKDLHSQRIVAEYASNLSRVGLDESEFLRRSSLLK